MKHQYCSISRKARQGIMSFFAASRTLRETQALQMPVIDRAGATMRVLDIDLRDGDIVLDHVEGAVAKQLLQREDIAAAAQKLNGKGVPHAVRMKVRHTGLLAQTIEQKPEAGLVHRLVVATQKEWVLWISVILLTLGQVAPQLAARTFLDKDKTLLAAFAKAHPHLAGLGVVIANRQATQFGGAQATVEQNLDQRAVAGGGAAFVGKAAPVTGLGLAAQLAGFEQGFDLFLVEGLDLGFLKLWGRDAVYRIGDPKFSLGPSEEGRERDPVVADRLYRQRFVVAAVDASWDIVSTQVSQIRADLFGGERCSRPDRRYAKPTFRSRVYNLRGC